jgi:acyl-CoA thioesterase
VADRTLGVFDRDTAVRLEESSGAERRFAAEVSPDWRAGRGPHGGYLAAILLRALIETVADPARAGGRAPRSLTIHYARAPKPGPVSIRTVIEREGRSLSTLSARMEQDGSLVALVLAAFSVPWPAREIYEEPMPDVAPPDPQRRSGKLLFEGAPPFTQHLELQPRIGVIPFQGASATRCRSHSSPTRCSRRRSSASTSRRPLPPSTSPFTSARRCRAWQNPIRTSCASRALAPAYSTRASSRRTA